MFSSALVPAGNSLYARKLVFFVYFRNKSIIALMLKKLCKNAKNDLLYVVLMITGYRIPY